MTTAPWEAQLVGRPLGYVVGKRGPRQGARMPAKELAEQAELMLLMAEHSINELLGQKRTAEARIAVTDAQRELRDLKRVLADEQRELRACITDERLKTERAGQVVGTFAGAKARAMARARSAQKRSIAGDVAATLRPYGVVRAYIDRGLANLDQIKAQITQTLAEQTPSSTPCTTHHPGNDNSRGSW